MTSNRAIPATPNAQRLRSVSLASEALSVATRLHIASSVSEANRRSYGAHMAFIWACCAAVSWTTFLGLQFQMDCVGCGELLS